MSLRIAVRVSESTDLRLVADGARERTWRSDAPLSLEAGAAGSLMVIVPRQSWGMWMERSDGVLEPESW